jgi:hypothetical protein
MIGIYFYIILTATIPDPIIYLAFILSGVLLVASVYGLARAQTRSARTSLTIISGLFGGAHAYMDIALFPMDWLFGSFLFIWFFLGLLIAAAALYWLPETDFETTAE